MRRKEERGERREERGEERGERREERGERRKRKKHTKCSCRLCQSAWISGSTNLNLR
jgi:hypothetical protein